MDSINSEKKKKDHASTIVFNLIAEDIANFRYLPGDKLPSENDLSAQYGVSRVTIRAALNMLSALGLIETRTGGGSYVKKFRFSDVTNLTAKVMVNQTTYSDITEYRGLLEKASIERLRFIPSLPSDYKYLEKCCEQMEQAFAKRCKADLAKADFNFHRKICQMSGNSMFVFSYDMLRSIMLEYFIIARYPKLTEADNEGSVWEFTIRAHKNILSKLINRDFDGAIDACGDMTSDRMLELFNPPEVSSMQKQQ